jgi:hypothetical protein
MRLFVIESNLGDLISSCSVTAVRPVNIASIRPFPAADQVTKAAENWEQSFMRKQNMGFWLLIAMYW